MPSGAERAEAMGGGVTASSASRPKRQVSRTRAPPHLATWGPPWCLPMALLKRPLRKEGPVAFTATGGKLSRGRFGTGIPTASCGLGTCSLAGLESWGVPRVGLFGLPSAAAAVLSLPCTRPQARPEAGFA